VYNLVPARGGFKFSVSTAGSCLAPDPNRAPAAPGEIPAPACGSVMVDRGRIHAFGVEMSVLAAELSDMLGRTVIDRTQFTGKLDVDLRFTPDDPTSGAVQFPSGNSGNFPPVVDPSVGSIFGALPEQLGLRLEPARSPVEVLVVDHVERPSEN